MTGSHPTRFIAQASQPMVRLPRSARKNPVWLVRFLSRTGIQKIWSLGVYTFRRPSEYIIINDLLTVTPLCFRLNSEPFDNTSWKQTRVLFFFHPLSFLSLSLSFFFGNSRSDQSLERRSPIASSLSRPPPLVTSPRRGRISSRNFPRSHQHILHFPRGS